MGSSPGDTPTLAAVLAELQTSLPAIHKTSEAQYGKYADLAVVSASLLPLMGKLGLSFSAKPTVINGEFGLLYKLRLAGCDETDEGFYPLSMVVDKGPQAIGSAITYARRYTLCAITGVAPDSDDDDAQAASPAPPQRGRKQRERPPVRPLAELPRNRDGSLSRSRITDEEFEAYGNMTAAQLAEHGELQKDASRGAVPGTERLTAPDPDDQWAASPPLRKPAPVSGVGGIITAHFHRLGVTDDPERYGYMSDFTGRKIGSVRDLSASEGVQLKHVIEKCGDLAAWTAALAARQQDRDAEVPDHA